MPQTDFFSFSSSSLKREDPTPESLARCLVTSAGRGNVAEVRQLLRNIATNSLVLSSIDLQKAMKASVGKKGPKYVQVEELLIDFATNQGISFTLDPISLPSGLIL